MRVAYLINQYPMVSHSFIRREMLALERQGFEVSRIAFRGWDSVLLEPEDHHERKRTRYVVKDGALPLLVALARIFLTRPARFLKATHQAWRLGRYAPRRWSHVVYLAEACRIVRWLRQAGVQHVHAHFGTNSAEVAMLTHTLGGPQWSFTVHGPEEFDKAVVIGLSEKIRRSAFAVAVSSFGRSQLYRYLEHQHWSKVHEVRCGLEAAFFSGPANVGSAKRLVCVGRLNEQKGQLLLLEATARLAVQNVKFQLVMAGDGEMRAEVEALIARHNLQSRVQITGWISGEQVREEILAARALVLPSFAEGLPVVIMEAMALRRPVISTFVAGIPELVIPGEHGWLVPAGDVDALAQAMKLCLDAPADRLAQMGEAAHQRVRARHDIDAETSKLAALFNSAAEGTRA